MDVPNSVLDVPNSVPNSVLSDSDREQAETRHWIDTALACEYISAYVHRSLLTQCKEIGRMLGSMMATPEKFCRVHKS
jgi:four helix bundle protein